MIDRLIFVSPVWDGRDRPTRFDSRKLWSYEVVECRKKFLFYKY